ncbi:MAG: AI-2E family transporter [Burkholderiaceae bacterium]|nr:AI-2E family transporter [Rhodoferax sp.]MCP5270856.1 AI-2E family transporter [Burkholderiaceae bacterium]
MNAPGPDGPGQDADPRPALPPAQKASGWRAALRRPATPVWLMAALALLTALWAGRSFVVTLLVATTMAVLLWPAVCAVQRWLHSRTLSALLVVLMAGAMTAGSAVVVATQISAAAQRTPEVLRLAARDVAALGSAGASTVQRTRHALRELDRSVARVTGTVAESGAAAVKKGSLVAGAVETMTAWLAHAARVAADLALQAAVMGMLTFFLLCSGDRLAAGISAWCDDRPQVRGRVAPLVSDLARQMRLYGGVTLATNLAIGAAVALLLLPFGVAQTWWWGALAAALHFVPYAGLAVLMVLAAAEVYVLHASWAAAATVVLLIAGVGFVIGTGMAAWLQGRASRVDSAIVFGGTVFFSVLWGGWGLVLGPLLVVVWQVVWRHARVQGEGAVLRAVTALGPTDRAAIDADQPGPTRAAGAG